LGWADPIDLHLVQQLVNQLPESTQEQQDDQASALPPYQDQQ
jgi:hypothetical protein